MPLDLGTTAAQIDRMAVHIADRRTGRELESFEPARYERWRTGVAQTEDRATVRFL